MDKQKELKKLTWKYFWQQKREEVCHFVKVLLVFVVLFDVTLIIVWILWLIETYIIIPNIIFYLLIFIGGLIFIPSIFRDISDWIKSNWEKATIRANKKLKIKKKNGNKK